jgi:hypothetical protein
LLFLSDSSNLQAEIFDFWSASVASPAMSQKDFHMTFQIRFSRLGFHRPKITIP